MPGPEKLREGLLEGFHVRSLDKLPAPAALVDDLVPFWNNPGAKPWNSGHVPIVLESVFGAKDSSSAATPRGRHIEGRNERVQASRKRTDRRAPPDQCSEARARRGSAGTAQFSIWCRLVRTTAT